MIHNNDSATANTGIERMEASFSSLVVSKIVFMIFMRELEALCMMLLAKDESLRTWSTKHFRHVEAIPATHVIHALVTNTLHDFYGWCLTPKLEI